MKGQKAQRLKRKGGGAKATYSFHHIQTIRPYAASYIKTQHLTADNMLNQAAGPPPGPPWELLQAGGALDSTRPCWRHTASKQPKTTRPACPLSSVKNHPGDTCAPGHRMRIHAIKIPVQTGLKRLRARGVTKTVTCHSPRDSNVTQPGQPAENFGLRQNIVNLHHRPSGTQGAPELGSVVRGRGVGRREQLERRKRCSLIRPEQA